jgi:hypothetical protein
MLSVVSSRCHGKGLKEFLVLENRISDFMFIIFDIPVILGGKFTDFI